jgi:hypothetical protein
MSFAAHAAPPAHAHRDTSAPQRLKVVNLFGPPGVGKSTVRSGVFWLMKSVGLSVEEVSEYAKYLVLTGRTWQLEREQLYLLSKQHHKQLILAGQYEYAVTDSPLLLSDFYAPKPYFREFAGLVAQAFQSFENINFYLTRDLAEGHFEATGRLHDRDQAQEVDRQMRQFLADRNIVCTELPIDILTPWRIVEHLAPGRAPWPQFCARPLAPPHHA